MAITKRGEVTGVTTSTSSTNINLPAGTAENDIVMIHMCSDVAIPGQGFGGLNTGQGYTDLYTTTSNAPGDNIAYKRMGSTPDTVVAITGNVRGLIYIIQVWTGVDTTTAIDQTTTTAAGVDPPSITTQTDGALVIASAIVDDKNVTVTTWPSGYSNQATQQAGTAAGYASTIAVSSKLISSAGAENPSAYVFSATDAQRAHSVALRPASGAAGTNVQINIGDAWKTIAGVKINIGDSWKTVAGMQVNIGDSWKTIF